MHLKLTGIATGLGMMIAQIMTPTSVLGDTAEDLIKVAVGLTAIGIIANEINKSNAKKKSLDLKRATEAAAEVASESVLPKERQQIIICTSAQWDGQNWRNQNNKICTPTPEVCLREEQIYGRRIAKFDFQCMQKQGFRLSQKYEINQLF